MGNSTSYYIQKITRLTLVKLKLSQCLKSFQQKLYVSSKIELLIKKNDQKLNQLAALKGCVLKHLKMFKK